MQKLAAISTEASIRGVFCDAATAASKLPAKGNTQGSGNEKQMKLVDCITKCKEIS